MKVKDLFRVGDLTQSIGGLAIFLDRDNCQVSGKTRRDDAVLLHMKRESDGEEGHAYLRVRKEFDAISPQLLRWTFADKQMMGKSLNELSDLETNLEPVSTGGRLMLG